MQKFFEFMEAREKTVVFTFGRFNPPTTGHEKLIKKVADIAAKYSADFFIYPSHSQSPKKDPLPHAKKVAYMRKMFPRYASKIVASSTDKTVINVATSLYNKGYNNCIMVVGSDRVKEFSSILSKYNGVEARHGYYKFDKFEVVSAGERDPDAEGVTGMSASKMRAAAVSNDFETFQKGLPKGFSDGKKLFDDIKLTMGVKESFVSKVAELTDDEKLRNDYIEGLIFNIGDVVEDVNTGAYGKVVRRGTNYLVFAESDGTIHKNWLFELKEIRRVKQDKDVEDKKGTQPAKYYAKDADGDKMSKSTKDARARHFAKGAKSDDDDPNAYKPAPGDKNADTKPSKHTLKYKKMFGEDLKYPKVKESKKGIQYIDGDYKTFESPEPPKPDSSEMIKEMKVVKKETNSRTLKDERSIINHDDDVAYAIKEYMDKNNLEYSKEDIEKISGAGETVSRFYKNKHQHPRPEQIDEKMEMNVDIMKKPSDSMNTPAYPSGHSLQSRLVAEYYKKKYPKHKNGLIEAAQECGEGRIKAGWHYPSDHKHGVELAEKTASMLNLNSSQQESYVIESNIYRVGSEKYFEHFREYKELYYQDDVLKNLSDFDIELLESDIGEFDMYKGEHIPLDCPMITEEEKVELNKPKRGGPKKYYVYVKDPKTGNVKKVSWGDTTGLKVKLDDPAARKSFAARHKCSQKTDKTKPGYWACRLPRYAKQLGLSGGGNFFW